MDSVDATICAKGVIPGSERKLISPKIDVQLKATSQEKIKNSASQIPFDISKKNYNELRSNTMVPRILIVLFLPSEEKDFFSFDEDKISLYGKGYWMSLKGMKKINNSSKVRIHIPEIQSLEKETIKELMICAANREDLAYATR